MHVTACLAGQKVHVEVVEDCRTLLALKEAIVAALPQLGVEGFDVSVGGRALDNDEGVVSLEDSTCLDVVPNTRVLSVLALREAGCEVSETGLREAARRGNVSLCTLYLDAGVPIDCTEEEVNTLHIACDNEHLDIARLLLDRGSTAIDEKDVHGKTPLHLSCDNEHVDIARLLLDRGSTAIDEKDVHGKTPLLISCRHGHLEIARLLLDRGSTAIDQKDDDGNTPLHTSCAYGNLDTATLLLDRGSTAIDEKDDDGSTPLHLSCTHGHLCITTLLVDRGSTAINRKDAHGNTPLHNSCQSFHRQQLEIVRLLLDRGCVFDARVEYYMKLELYRQPVLELLSQRGRDTQPRTDDCLESAKRRRIGEQ